MNERILRHRAQKDELILHRSRTDGKYYLVDSNNCFIFPASYGELGIGASLDEIDEYLSQPLDGHYNK